MKKLALIFVFIIFISCTDANDETKIDETLAGEWVLTNVYCFCYFASDTDFSSHRLIFDVTKNKVTVVNETAPDYFHEAGQFSYNNQGNSIGLEDSSNAYTYQVEGSILTLSYVDEPMIADDEVTYVYRRK